MSTSCMQGTNLDKLVKQSHSLQPQEGHRRDSQLHKKKQCLVIKALIKSSAGASATHRRSNWFSTTGGTIYTGIQVNLLGPVGAGR